MQKGKVFLIGAGPGDPGLITMKAVEALGAADAVVYDFLANPLLLAHASPDAEIIYVGKKGGNHTLSQGGINELLVRLAGEGKTVARLKGGDPFVFGRGGEEAEDLAADGIPFEIVPGVTSAIAAPAYAGIPVTHRSFTSGVGFITGHEDPTKPESSINWDKIATGFGTLVFLMGVKNLENITANLIKAGRSGETPAALVRWGSTPKQATLVSTVADIAAKAREKGFKAPSVLIVGEVVSLREKLNWFEILPLFGKTVLVTRTRAQVSRLREKLAGLGARVIECPTIRLIDPEDWAPVDKAVKELGDYDWLVLTSPNGVDFFFRRIFENGFDARALASAKVAAIGPATDEKLREYGIKADLLPEKFVAEGLVEAMLKEGVDGEKILLARAEEARDVLPVELEKAGATVTEVALYRTVPPEGLTPDAKTAIDNGEVDLITFTSSSTVTNFVDLMGDDFKTFAQTVPAASIGPITGDTAKAAGLNVAAEADVHTIDGLVDAVLKYLAT